MSSTPPSPAITLPGEPAVTVEIDVPCPMRDGVVLRADVYRPVGDEGTWPVLLMRLPYDKTQAEDVAYAHPAWYAGHGYLVVVQDCRGRWASDGGWEPFRDEAADGEDTIAWAAALPGSNGKVGMWGFSYAGATQLLPATRRPPALAAICPAMTASSYDEGWTFTGGALNLAFVASWATDLAVGDARKRGDIAAVERLAKALGGARGWFHSLPLDTYPPLDADNGGYYFDWLAHAPDDDYWRRWSIGADYGRIATPALHVGGWYDIFLEGTVRNFVGLRRGAATEAARAAQKLLIGPWHHMPWVPHPGTVPAGGAPADHGVVDARQVAWFDLHLKGQPTDLLDAPVTVYVMGDGRWRDFADWPPPEATPTPFYLHSNGRANSAFGDGRLDAAPPAAEPADRFTYDPLAPVASLGGQSCCYPEISPMGPVDQGAAEQWNSVLVYTSDPLERDLLLVGDAAVTLFSASSARDTDWTARLCTVDPAGRSVNLKAGIVRARFRDGTAAPSLIEPHRVYEYAISLGPIGVRVPAGHSIRLSVSSSDFPHWDRNLNSGGPLFAEGIGEAVVATQTVLHDAARPSRLVLPVIEEDAELGAPNAVGNEANASLP